MLRPYQQKAVDEIRAIYASGVKKALLHLATGGGKTVIFCHVLKSLQSKGKKGIMVVRGRHLVDQGSQRLAREGVEHGVMMAGHWRNFSDMDVQVCSIDTLRARSLAPEADLIVIDEAHLATSSSYLELLERYGPETYILAVTATPFVPKGLRHIADEIVKPVTFDELVADGYLVPPVYYALAPPDLSGVGISRATGDFKEKDLAPRCNEIIGDIITTWLSKGEGRPTVAFAVDVNHSKSIVKAFRGAGVPAEHIDANTPDNERLKAIDELRKGRLKVLSNVGILCTGVDMPHVSCLIMARPTLSYNLYIQQAGRGTRPADGKQNFILLDHAGNVPRHGFIETEREADLDGYQAKAKTVMVPPISTCKACFAVFPPSTKLCPRCGHPNRDAEKEVVQVDGELKLVTREDAHNIRIAARFAELKDIKRRKGYRRGWIWFQLNKEFGEEVANQLMPKREIPDHIQAKLKKKSA